MYLDHKSLAHIKIHCIKRERREMKREKPAKATETGSEKADPASGDGAGAIAKSWADTVAAATKASVKATMMLTLVIVS